MISNPIESTEQSAEETNYGVLYEAPPTTALLSELLGPEGENYELTITGLERCIKKIADEKRAEKERAERDERQRYIETRNKRNL